MDYTYLEIDAQGRMVRKRRRKNDPPSAVADGTRLVFSSEFMDGREGVALMLADADRRQHATAGGYRSGYQFAGPIFADSATVAAQDAAAIAYEDRNKRLQNAWRARKQQDDEPRAPAAPRSLNDARQAAEEAYAERNHRLTNGWRRKFAHQDAENEDTRRAPPRSLADAQDAARRAYDERSERMRNAWRTKG